MRDAVDDHTVLGEFAHLGAAEFHEFGGDAVVLTEFVHFFDEGRREAVFATAHYSDFHVWFDSVNFPREKVPIASGAKNRSQRLRSKANQRLTKTEWSRRHGFRRRCGARLLSGRRSACRRSSDARRWCLREKSGEWVRAKRGCRDRRARRRRIREVLRPGCPWELRSACRN